MKGEAGKILVIDDDRAVCASMHLLFVRKGYEVRSAHLPVEAFEVIEVYKPSVILLDMNFTIDTSGIQGLKMLRKLRQDFADIPVILLTGWATVQLAVEGMKLGAVDFLAKPWDNDQLSASVLNALSTKREFNGADESDLPVIVGRSARLTDIISLSEKVAKTEANILISGESGTGKELIAELIHQNSRNASGPFVKTNLGGVSHTLFESELYGHVKGAFTDAVSDRVGRFTLAKGGSLFLDEIGELTLGNQVKLLRVLQDKKYEILGSSKSIGMDCRIICATNRDLPNMVNAGTFREDLYYRINLIPLHLPPLRERPEDIGLLVNYFIKKSCDIYDLDVPIVEQEAIDYLSKQPFPGNIRQLKNEVERTLLLNQGKRTLNREDFFKQMFGEKRSTLSKTEDFNLKEMEVAMINKALTKYDYSISNAARALGLTRSALYRRLEKYNIPYES